MAQRIIKQSGGAANICGLEEVQVGLNLKHRQRVAGATLGHGVNDIELLDGLNNAEKGGGKQERGEHW